MTWATFAVAAVRDPHTFFEELEVDGFGIPLTFSLLSITIAAYLSLAVQVARNPIMLQYPTEMIPLLVLGALTGLVGGTVIILLWGALTHLFVRSLGGGTYHQTVVATAYATAVTAFAGWIPVLRLLAPLYLVYVQFVGIQQLHDLSRNHAAVAAALPYLVVLGAGAALYAVDPMLLVQLEYYVSVPQQVAQWIAGFVL